MGAIYLSRAQAVVRRPAGEAPGRRVQPPPHRAGKAASKPHHTA